MHPLAKRCIETNADGVRHFDAGKFAYLVLKVELGVPVEIADSYWRSDLPQHVRAAYRTMALTVHENIGAL